MHRFLSLLAVGLSLVFAHAPARAQAPEVTLTRMDCGTGGPPGDMNLRFSDTFSLVGLKMSLVYSKWVCSLWPWARKKSCATKSYKLV